MERYEKEIWLTYADCDCYGRARVGALMHAIQEAAGEHLDALKLPREKLWREGFVFLLTRVRLTITRMPCAGEVVRIATQPYQPKGVQYFRDVFFTAEDGTALLTAHTAWVLVDPNGHKIRRPSELPYEIPVAQGGNYTWVRQRLQRPEEAVACGTRTVRFSDIDVNQHMNNAVYANIVSDCLPLALYCDSRLCEYTISFIGEAQLGEGLLLSAGSNETGSWYVGARKSDGGMCFEAWSHWK